MLTDRTRQIIQAGLLVIFVAWICFGSWYSWQSSKSPHAPTNRQTTKQTDEKAAHYNPLYDFWQWTTHDAVSFYTFVLAIFTGLLGGVAIVQICYLIRADETARRAAIAATRAAIAARKSAEHIPRVERAYVSGGLQWTGSSATQFRVMINNYGKTPAFIGTVMVQVILTLPPEPAYGDGEFVGYTLKPDTEAHPSNVTGLCTNSRSVIYGRIYYRDIFNRCHSSGFALRALPNLPAVNAPDAYWEDRDEPDLGPAAP